MNHLMSWFRKTLNEEFDYLIANLEYGKIKEEKSINNHYRNTSHHIPPYFPGVLGGIVVSL